MFLRRYPQSLLFVSLAMLALRIAWIMRFREIDSDAYGHFFIATATRDNPTNLAVHWVWLPLYHFIVAGLTALGLTFRGLRILNAILATAGPLLLYDVALTRFNDKAIANISAIAFALAPLTTILGQSAQPEMLFSVLIVLSLYEVKHPARAGLWLAVACMVRYEAWGAVLALAIWWVLRTIAKRHKDNDVDRPEFAWVAIPCAVIAIYILFRWRTDGKLLLFFRGTRDITATQVAPVWTFYDVVSFPIILPYMIFGPTIVLVVIGWRRAFATTRAWILPLGFALFLLISYYGGGSHAAERYLVSLVPFGCLAFGQGAARASEWLHRVHMRKHAVAVASLTILALTTAWHLRRAGLQAIAWDDDLRQREERVEHHLPPDPQMR